MLFIRLSDTTLFVFLIACYRGVGTMNNDAYQISPPILTACQSFFKMGEKGILLVLCIIGSAMGNTGCIPGSTCPPRKNTYDLDCTLNGCVVVRVF